MSSPLWTWKAFIARIQLPLAEHLAVVLVGVQDLVRESVLYMGLLS